MPPPVAALLFTVTMAGLFWLDRGDKARTSTALWIPLIWFAIACSRPLGVWLQIGSSIDTADQMADGSPVDRLAWAVLLAFGVMVLIGRHNRLKGFLLPNAAVTLFFLYCAVSLLWSDFPDVAFKRWIKAVGDLLMVAIVWSDAEPVAAFNRLLQRMTYTLIPLSVLFIKYYPGIGVTYFPWGGKPNIGGVTTNKNSLGVISLYFGLWMIWRLLDTYRDRSAVRRLPRMVGYSLVLAMVFWLIHTANSLTSLNSLLMGAALLALATSRGWLRRPAVVNALMIVMAAASASILFFGASPDALKAMGRNSTLTDRTEIWSVVLSMVRDSWLGTGFESFWLGPRLEKLWSMYWWHPQEAHNGYVEIYLMLGWIGIVLLAVVIAANYRTVLWAWRKGSPTGAIGLAYFFVGLIYNFTEASFFRMEAVSWLFFLLATVKLPWASRSTSAILETVRRGPGDPQSELGGPACQPVESWQS